MKKFSILILTIAAGAIFAGCSMLGSKPAKPALDELYYVSKEKDNGKLVKGFMDKTGKLVLGPWESFEWNGKKYGADDNSAFKVMPFIEGMAGICFYDETPYSDDKAKCGFIDKTGKIVIEPKYKSVSYFSEGLAPVSLDRRLYGYIDKTGKQVIEPKFTTLSPFSDGLAVARADGASESGYIDPTGKFVIEAKYKFPTSFGDGVAIVENDKQERLVIDKTGKEVKNLGLARAGNTRYYYKETINYDFYRVDGEYAIEEYTMTPSFADGLTMLNDDGLKNDPIGYAKPSGELEVKLDRARVARLRPFAEGFAPVGLEPLDKDQLTGLLGAEATKDLYDWTYVDRKGEYKVQLKDTFADARPFAEGLAAVSDRGSKGKWGFINTEFKAATPFCFDKVGDFRAGLALVSVDPYAENNCGQYAEFKSGRARDIYIDKTGRAVKPQW
ncbi:MAG: WG repeat-containing protein [Acidobacteria bacterium]|nr:WG repeat-containing protein [Acidobacteriota bacterium]